MDAKETLLDKIVEPEDLRRLDESDLKPLVDELRAELIRVVSCTGGHLGAGLGVVELTVALHYIFDTPRDRLIWDVGHQSYPHKILTGRRNRMTSLRQGGGLSGFTKRAESEYDPFGAAHAATSISAGLGMAVARDLRGEDNHIICVIGDGSMSAGMAYEAMNNAGAMDSRLIVILNDNDMSIAPPVGAISAYLARLLSSASYRGLRNFAKQLTKKLPRALSERARRAEEYARGMALGGTIFEELGFYYVGPIDGHNLDHLLPVMRNVRESPNGPILMHVVTHKGKGYPPAETSADKFHGVAKFDIATGAQQKSKANAPSYTKVFSDTLVQLAEENERIVAITAAMPSGTGLDRFAKRFPKRCFDVGIAEQHAVTFAAGLASEGFRPFAALYSTFLQRAYDQVIHDVAIQNLPVRFAIDRAGLVGADGATHAGSFDMAYLGIIPNFVVMAPANESELRHMVATAASLDGCPCSFRFPRGVGCGVVLPERGEVLEVGRGRIIRRGEGLALVSVGDRLGEVKKAAEQLETLGVKSTIVDVRFVKPLDKDLLLSLVMGHEAVLVVESGSIGGVGSQVLDLLSGEGCLSGGLRARCLRLPDVFLDQDDVNEMYRLAGLDSDSIFRAAAELLELDDYGRERLNVKKI